MRMVSKSASLLYCFSILLFLFSSCNKTVTITREYIYYKAWGKGEYQGFTVAKIKLEDTSISVFNEHFNQYDLVNHFIDSSFCFYHFTGNKKYDSKSYFNQVGDILSWRKCDDLLNEKKTIGLLELNTWYIFKGLNGTEDFYAYIDKDGKAHTYSLGPTNW